MYSFSRSERDAFPLVYKRMIDKETRRDWERLGETARRRGSPNLNLLDRQRLIVSNRQRQALAIRLSQIRLPIASKTLDQIVTISESNRKTVHRKPTDKYPIRSPSVQIVSVRYYRGSRVIELRYLPRTCKHNPHFAYIFPVPSANRKSLLFNHLWLDECPRWLQLQHTACQTASIGIRFRLLLAQNLSP